MSGRRSRDKGARVERAIVHALQAGGFAAERVPLSGAVGGRYVIRLEPPFDEAVVLDVARLRKINGDADWKWRAVGLVPPRWRM
jgi:hypothetical protein